ncbi:MAG: DUF4834 family protein, partial [Prevotellaceae bacterium]|nr:DUF4834 family protein [Prevotellaceae bacterium]
FLLIIVLLILILSWFFRVIMGYFARTFFNIDSQANSRPKTQRKAGKQGDIHIDRQPARDKKIKNDVGEYVDYEEIK